MICEIANADAIEYMRHFGDNTFDLIVIDPDYNYYDELLRLGLYEEAIRVLKDTGNLIFFTKQPFDHNLRNAIDRSFRREIVWTFTNGGAWCSNKMPLVSFQKIYWCVKSKDFFFNPRTGIGYSKKTKNFDRDIKVFGDWTGQGKPFRKSEDGIWLRDHLHYNKPQSGKIPAKPKELAEIIIRCFSPDDGVILDAFSGRGTFAWVADNLGRKVYASEIDRGRWESIINMLTGCKYGNDG